MNLLNILKMFSSKIFRSNCRIEHRKGRIKIKNKVLENVPMKVVYRKNKSCGEDVFVHIPQIGTEGKLETKFTE